MQSKNSMLHNSRTNPAVAIAAAKAIAPDATVCLSADGTVTVDGQTSAEFNGITGLLSITGPITGRELRRMAIYHHTSKLDDSAKRICIVIENRQGRRIAYTQQGIQPLDGLSAAIVQVGAVYVSKVGPHGFVMVEPNDELILQKGTQLEPHFGHVPDFVFQQVHDLIRDRRLEEERLAAARHEAEREQSFVDQLASGQRISMGAFA